MKIRLPRFKFALRNFWLGGMIEHKSLIGMLVDEACRFDQLSFVDENVVCQAMACELPDAAIKLWPVKISIGLSLDHLTQANEGAGMMEAAKNLWKVIRFKRSPAHHPSYERRRLCAFQQPVCLLK